VLKHTCKGSNILNILFNDIYLLKYLEFNSYKNLVLSNIKYLSLKFYYSSFGVNKMIAISF
jgi:hypothetical protein